jgi:hypothetical protein
MAFSTNSTTLVEQFNRIIFERNIALQNLIRCRNSNPINEFLIAEARINFINKSFDIAIIITLLSPRHIRSITLRKDIVGNFIITRNHNTILKRMERLLVIASGRQQNTFVNHEQFPEIQLTPMNLEIERQLQIDITNNILSKLSIDKTAKYHVLPSHSRRQ